MTTATTLYVHSHPKEQYPCSQHHYSEFAPGLAAHSMRRPKHDADLSGVEGLSESFMNGEVKCSFVTMMASDEGCGRWVPRRDCANFGRKWGMCPRHYDPDSDDESDESDCDDDSDESRNDAIKAVKAMKNMKAMKAMKPTKNMKAMKLKKNMKKTMKAMKAMKNMKRRRSPRRT